MSTSFSFLLILKLQNLISVTQTLIPISDCITINRELFYQFFKDFKDKNEFYRLLQVLRNVPKGIRSFNNNRRKDGGVPRNRIYFEDEYDFQDYLRLILHANFEFIYEYPISPKTFDSPMGKVEFFIPDCHALVECKFIDSKEKKRRTFSTLQTDYIYNY